MGTTSGRIPLLTGSCSHFLTGSDFSILSYKIVSKSRCIFVAMGHECPRHFFSRSTTLRSLCCDVLAGMDQSVLILVELVLTVMSPVIVPITISIRPQSNHLR